MLKRQSKIFGGTMLIAGTSIGSAILAMPIMTGLFGFFGTVVIMIACWLFMYWTAMLIVEANLQFADGASFVTMARRSLGPIGAGATWCSFLLLFYSLVAAYLRGSGHILMDALESTLPEPLPKNLDILPLLLVFAPFIYFGLSIVDHLNRYLMVGMGLTYAAIIFWLFPHVHVDRLLYVNWSFSLLSFSVVVTSFGYHNIIPTLVTYLDHDVKSLKACLFFGSLIPLLIYLLWEVTILGTISVSGAHGLAMAYNGDVPLVRLLRFELNSDLISALARGFSIFAIVTSFLGVAQGLFDFLKDGLRTGTSHTGRMVAFLLTFLPPVLLIIVFESGFIALLEYAGALVAIILGIIPILIVWRLRAVNGERIAYRAPGNRLALALGLCFFAFVVMLVVLKNAGLLTFDVESLI